MAEDFSEPIERNGKAYWPCVPGVNPETGEWACGICGAPGEEDCIESEHEVREAQSLSQAFEDTWFDLWLERHPRLDRFYTLRWLTWETRVKRFFSFKRNWDDWRWSRQFRPGGFFLDHGTVPSVVTTVRNGAVYGVSLLNGTSVVSDLYHCGPVPTNEKAAWVAANRLRGDQ